MLAIGVLTAETDDVGVPLVARRCDPSLRSGRRGIAAYANACAPTVTHTGGAVQNTAKALASSPGQPM